MKRMLIATVATLGLITVAAAQSSSTTVTTTTPGGAAATGSISIAPEQRTKIREFVTKEQRASVPAPSGFSVGVGATLPQTVEVYPFPADVGVTQYRYSVVGGQTVIVDAGTRRIVQVIE
jgi:hypothetical protein